MMRSAKECGGRIVACNLEVRNAGINDGSGYDEEGNDGKENREPRISNCPLVEDEN
jgi:hypothetical protein